MALPFMALMIRHLELLIIFITKPNKKDISSGLNHFCACPKITYSCFDSSAVMILSNYW